MDPAAKRNPLRAFTVTFFLFSLMLFAGNIFAEISNALVFNRAVFSLWMCIVFLIPAAFLYLGGRGPIEWTNWSWTFAFASYLVHFYFAFGEIHGFSIVSVYAKQGWLTATYNYAITAGWLAFTVLLWTKPGRFAAFNYFFVLLLLAGMLTASIVLKDGIVSWLGYVLLAATLGAAMVRLKNSSLARRRAGVVQPS